jgi:anthranilate synthase component 1
MLGWDVAGLWERLPHTTVDDRGLPLLALSLVSDLVALDHHTGSTWLIANAINGDGTDERVDEAWEDAVARLDEMQRALAAPRPAVVTVLGDGPEPALRLRRTPEDFEAAVRAGKEAIRDGEVFQVVLSLRVDVDCEADPLEVYRSCGRPTPARTCTTSRCRTRAARWPHRHRRLLAGDPVRVEGRAARTYPIAGSRPRGTSPEEDRALEEELRADPKERAEHLMLVDLARNDLARVCDPATVSVTDFMAVRRFSHIMHMASTVTGTLRDGVSALDALVATFRRGRSRAPPRCGPWN